MFKLRSGGSGANAPAPPPTIETLRRRARQRLIGAGILVLAGVIGLPLLFDTQPRPVPVDIAIEIPDRQPAQPLPVQPPTPAPATEAAPAAPLAAPVAPVAPVPAPAPAATAPALTTPPATAPTAPVAAPAPAPAAPTAPATARPATPPAPTEASRAQAILEGRTPAAAPTATPATPQRLVVQVGAFESAERVREVRQRLERAGLVTYTHVAQTPDGPRTRVRLGPFASRAEAERAAERVRQLGLPAAILTL